MGPGLLTRVYGWTSGACESPKAIYQSLCLSVWGLGSIAVGPNLMIWPCLPFIGRYLPDLYPQP